MIPSANSPANDATSQRPVEPLTRPAVAAMVAEIEGLVHTDPARAAELAGAATRAARQMDAPDLEAQISYVHARLRAERGELDEALQLIEAARRLWSTHGSPLSAARTDLGRMQILDDLGRHREALGVGESLLETLSSLRDEQMSGEDAALFATTTAAVLGNIGVAQSFLGHHEESLRSYEQSERGYAGLGMTVQVAQQRANRGIELLALGRAREARTAMAGAESDFRAAGDLLWAAKCAAHLADAQLQTGALVEALRALERARSELAALGASAEEVRVQLQLGRVHLEAGLLPEANESALEALRLAEQTGLVHDAAMARLTLAAVHLRGARLADAEKEALTAAALFGQVGDEQFHARAQLLSAKVAADQGDPRTADLLAAAAENLRTGGWLVPLTWALLYQSDLADGSARADLLGQAADLVGSLGIPSLEDALVLRQARSAVRHGSLDEAVHLLRALVDRVDLHGHGHGDPLLRVATRTDATAAHDALVDVLITRGGDDDAVHALLVSDDAKAQTLRDLRAGSGRAPTPDPTSTPLGDQMRSDLASTYSALEGALETQDRRRLQGRAQRLEARIGSLRLGRAVGGSGSQVTRPLERGGSLQTLSPTLAYHVVGADIVCFAMADGEVGAVRLVDGVARAAALSRELTAQWARFDLGPAFVDRHAEALEGGARQVLVDTYDLLLRPVQAWLDDRAASGSRDLVIVPHRALYQVPFAALNDGLRSLVERWTLTLSPTARPLIAGPRPTPAPPSSELLLLAVPDERAPLVAVEADRIRHVVPQARVLVGAEATRAALVSALPGPGHVHFACHGLHRPDNPVFSALRLADGWLTCTDLLDLPLDGALLTLSACDSGEIGIDFAEPLGLAWAGLAAGASGVVVSQRVLDDAAAASLMSDFHTALAGGMPPAAALRNAQLTRAAEQPHPYYWAAMAYVATPGAAATDTAATNTRTEEHR